MKVFSGIRPSGQLHLGNYFGAIRSWIDLQKDNECFFCIADLHAITTAYSPKDLKKYTIQTAVDYLSLGIDPKKSTLFVQSAISQHSELAWFLATIASVSEITRMTQYKAKIQELGPSSATAALLEYPLLMAADILLYQAEAVPVGKDQVQHVELARTLARRFNRRFGKTFAVPKVILSEQGFSIKSLQNPRKKMSKAESGKSCIFLSDSPQEIKKKFSVAVTDSGKNIEYNPERKPGISNLINIYALAKNLSPSEINKLFQNANYQEFKQAVSQEVIKMLQKFQADRQQWIENPLKTESVLKEGKHKAEIVAQATMAQVRKKLGLY